MIWKYKQVGRIYDFYYDGMRIHREGGNDLIGVDKVVRDTLACLAAFPDLEFKFYSIKGVGNAEEGFHFGQSVYIKGTFNGIGKYGKGTGEALPEHGWVELCECLVKKVDGRFRVVEEWGVRSTGIVEQILQGSIVKADSEPCECTSMAVECEDMNETDCCCEDIL